MLLKGELRGCDDYGCGGYGAQRVGRLHQGLDIRCFGGQKIYSPITGEVTKIGFPYKQTDLQRKHFRYVEISVTEALKIRLYYVIPDVKKGDKIIVGEVIGFQQELGNVYIGIKEHVHLEVIINSHHVNPINFYETRCLN